ncbi:MAG: DNA-3-methyladenine glycosylase I [Candidatus Delongbacteria bacterium]|nr:DNA-3-methyladenine glycosylase I [Candidatus Delongbacteria bacterium]
MNKRCAWADSDPLYVTYHDLEWGVPVHDDRKLFEMLVLEAAQAGLSWLTILKKRENYRAAIDEFDPELIARYETDDIERLMADAGIVRNRLKIESAIRNARAALKIREEFGSLDRFLWGLIPEAPLQNSWEQMSEIPARTPQSDLMSNELKRRGFNFVGPTICYAFMQAVGMVNDHVTGCFRYREI